MLTGRSKPKQRFQLKVVVFFREIRGASSAEWGKNETKVRNHWRCAIQERIFDVGVDRGRFGVAQDTAVSQRLRDY